MIGLEAVLRSSDLVVVQNWCVPPLLAASVLTALPLPGPALASAATGPSTLNSQSFASTL